MEEKDQNMSLLGHVNELRKRLLICVITLVITVVASFAFSQYIAPRGRFSA